MNIYGDEIKETNVLKKFLTKVEGGIFEMEELLDGDESYPEGKWIQNIKKPSTMTVPADNNIPKPALTVALDYCYGYRVK